MFVCFCLIFSVNVYLCLKY